MPVAVYTEPEVEALLLPLTQGMSVVDARVASLEGRVSALEAAPPSGSGSAGTAVRPAIEESRTECWGQMGVTGSLGTQWYTIYRKEVTSVTLGEWVLIAAESQIRNDNGFGVEVAEALVATPLGLADATPSSSRNDTTGTLLINGDNVDPARHYDVAHKTLWWKSPGNYARVLFELRLRARSSMANGNQNLTVNAGQGYIQVARWV